MTTNKTQKNLYKIFFTAENEKMYTLFFAETLQKAIEIGNEKVKSYYASAFITKIQETNINGKTKHIIVVG
jgi:hypothetical protein